ncbi:MAG: OsmC family protein [Nitrospirae bacterium]|nr:OsmC family protein [Nitrospirota bacterium]
MGRINNVDIDKMRQFGEQIKADPSKARKTQVIEGEWLVQEGGAQFRSTINFEGGKTVFEMDSPTFMGGGGKLPGPMHYCFYGLAACYTATFATMASMLGIELKRLTTRVEADVNFSRVFGVSDAPVMEEVRVTLSVVSSAPEEKIREAEGLAIQRCPVVFTLKNPVKLTPYLKISRAP